MTAALTTSMCMTAFAATAQEVIAKNPTSYTAGTSSVYGAKLNQDQLNAVAQAAADFKTNYVNDTMSNDQKIRAGYDYIKNNVDYIDWRESTYANTAYGCLVEKKAACSGMTRAFVALMDAVDVKAYWIHGATNDHQWNMVEFNDGFYFIDIDANIASGAEFIYKASTHPYSYDTAAYPAIGSKSGQSTTGTQAVNSGWKEENGSWYYYESNGQKAVNKWIDGKYYVGADGVMLTNTTTPDGYQVGSDGAWVQENSTAENKQYVYSIWEAKKAVELNGSKSERKTTDGGSIYYLLSNDTTSFTIGDDMNLNPERVNVNFTTFTYNPETMEIYPFSNDGTDISYPFDYNTTYELQIPQNPNLRGIELANYCKQRHLVIAVGFQRPDEFEVSMFYFIFE